MREKERERELHEERREARAHHPNVIVEDPEDVFHASATPLSLSDRDFDVCKGRPLRGGGDEVQERLPSSPPIGPDPVKNEGHGRTVVRHPFGNNSLSFLYVVFFHSLSLS